MPIYEHRCETCDYEWEDYFSSWKSETPECPKCNKDSNVTRLLSIPTIRVEYSGYELKRKLKEDAAKMKKDIYKSENESANLIGETKFQETQKTIDKVRNDS